MDVRYQEGILISFPKWYVTSLGLLNNLVFLLYNIEIHMFKTLAETAKEAKEKAKETALAAPEKAKDLASKAATKQQQQQQFV